MKLTEEASRWLLIGSVIALVVAVLLAQTASPSECLAIGALSIHTTAFALRLVEPSIERFFARSQPYFGPIVLILCIGLVVMAMKSALFAFAKLMAMLASLLAIPFGTIFYLAKWGDFPRSEARMVLGSLMMLLLVSAGLNVLSNVTVVRNVRLVFAFLFALLLIAFVSLAHGIVPNVLAAITDAVAAILLAIVGGVAALRVGFSQIRPIRGLIEKVTG